MAYTRLFFIVLISILFQALPLNAFAEELPANEAVDPEGLFKLPGFHQVMVSSGNKTIYIAGQVPYDAEMKLVGSENYKEQTIRALQNVVIALKAAGAEPEDVVSSNLNIKGLNIDVAEEVMGAMSIALDGKPFPAHAFTMVGVQTLVDPKILIEISAVAVTDSIALIDGGQRKQ